MAIINKDALKNLSSNTYIDNTTGQITPGNVRFFNNELIDSLVDETGYGIDSGSWNDAIAALTASIVNIISNTGSFVLNSQTSSMSVATASYVDLRGDNVTINYANGWIEITGSESNAQVLVSDTAPTASLYNSGTLWFNSTTTAMYVNYYNGGTYTWIGVSAAGPVISASYSDTSSLAYTASLAQTASYFFTSSVTSASIARTAQTASYFLTSSVTSASRAEYAAYAEVFYTSSVTNATNATYALSASWIDIVGKGIEINNWFGQYQLTASQQSAEVIVDTVAPPTSLDQGTLWFDSGNSTMYVLYNGVWTVVSSPGTTVSSSYSLSSSLAQTASYIDVTGSGVLINWFGSQLQLTASSDSEVIISDTAPIGAETGSLWFNSLNTSMYVYYNDGFTSQWIGVAGAGPVVTASYAFTSSHALFSNTASYALEGGNQNLQSVTTFGNSTSRSIDIRDRIQSNVTGSGTFTQGFDVEARGLFAHAQGFDTLANGDYSHAQGASTQALGLASHAEGSNTIANGNYSNAKGEGSTANGVGSHAEGYYSNAVGRGSHAEGSFTLAEGNFSNASGENTWALGRSSNASGLFTVAQGIASNTEGRYTNAAADYQSIVGQWNIPLSSTDTQGYFIIGDGNGMLGDPKRLHNLLTAGDGVVSISGSLNVENPITGSITNAISASYALSASHANTSISSSYALSASAAISSSYALSASNALSASYIDVTGSGVLVNWFGSQLQLTASGVTPIEVDTLQSVTTRGNHTSQSVHITASLTNGRQVLAIGQFSHAEGESTIASGSASHAEGIFTTAKGPSSHAEGDTNIAVGYSSHAEGNLTTAIGLWSHAEGIGTIARGDASHTEGSDNIASGSYSHAEGNSTVTVGAYSHAEGFSTTAKGILSHAEGQQTISEGQASHTEGRLTIALGEWSHAEGLSTLATGRYSHAEGDVCVANGSVSHAEGGGTTAKAFGSHAEGRLSISSGSYSHAEGLQTIAIGDNSHTEGLGTITNATAQHAQGQYNAIRTEQSAIIIGNGANDANRSNMFVALPTLNKMEFSSSICANIGDYANDAAAASGGVPLTGLYHTAGVVKIRLV